MLGLLKRLVETYERNVRVNEQFLALRQREAACREREVDSAVRRDTIDNETALSWKPAASQVSRDVTEIKRQLDALALLTGSKDE